MLQKNAKKPLSETNLLLNFTGVAAFFLAIYALFHNESTNITTIEGQVNATIITIFASLLPLLLGDLIIRKIYRQPHANLSTKSHYNIKRTAIKYLGLLITYAIILGIYQLFPEYGTYYDRFFLFIKTILPYTLIFALFYFPYIDSKMNQPEDGYWHLGIAFLRCFRLTKQQSNTVILAEHARSWLVKAFFLPLMFTFLSNNVNFLLNFNYNSLPSWHEIFSHKDNFARFYDFLYSTIFTIDVIFACIGYLMTFRLLNAHIRSAEPTAFGWLVCLLCYPPFWAGLFSDRYFAYNDGQFWGGWLGDMPSFYMAWGCLILVLISIYTLATIALGYRFSNLTYRGLVTSGPYRFTKHPAYISKCLSWWLISMPFLSHEGTLSATRASLMLGFLCLIYFLRARTEENHLSNYPEYVEYANWMNQHGIFKHIGKYIPFFAYDESRAQKSNSKIWKKKLTQENIK